MILTVASWCWIGLAAFVCGFSALQIFDKGKCTINRGMDVYILMGLCVLTVYAQIFSLFYKVGGVATFILMAVVFLLVIIFRKNLWNCFKDNIKKIRPVQYILLGFVLALVLVLTLQYAAHVDTDLYHAQSIRWIEEFGIVKGLGNLHSRLAYNSAFFSLQALFSLKFAVRQSLNTVNGFITSVMLVYAFLSLNPLVGKRMKTSDLFKICLIYYLWLTDTRYVISSPGSDLPALSLALYLCAKWCEYMESKDKEGTDYGILCLLAVWALTIKLSVAMMTLFALYPAVEFLRKRQWKQIVLFLVFGIMIIVPFLSRNVIISGYLVYPSAAIDIFDVDWKMPISMVIDDSTEISAWGKGLTSRNHYQDPISVWFPQWYRNLSLANQFLFCVNICGLFWALIYFFRCAVKRKEAIRCNLLVTSIAGLLMWFFSAPLIRYGSIYMLFLPAIICGFLVERYLYEKVAKVCVVFLIMGSILFEARFAAHYGMMPLKRPNGYYWGVVTSGELGGYTFYLPVKEYTYNGYFYFPATPHSLILERLELRTGKLEDGFRVKEEYQGMWMRTDGIISE